MIQVGDHLPQGQLVGFVETLGGKFGPQIFDVSDAVKGKKIAVLALPRTVGRDVVKRVEACKEQGAEEIWCLGSQDPAIVAAWSRELKAAAGQVRLVADGSGVYTQALGLSADYVAAGNAASRSSLLVEDGIVKQLNVDASIRLEASNDEKPVAQAA